jgi:hypothetical protein
MVNNVKQAPSTRRAPLVVATSAVRGYLVLVLATLIALVVLSFSAPDQAGDNAWGHAIVVSVFAVVLPLRLRRARSGHRATVRAIGLIASVLLVVNVVEALIPGFVPAWMRVQMYVVAALMLVVVLDVVRWAVTTETG